MKFYPKIQTLLALDDLPKEFNFLKEPLEDALNPASQ